MAAGVRRAEIWTVSGGPGYAGKPRPAVIVQDDRLDTDSVTICPFTSDPTDAPLFRLLVEPDDGKGLGALSRIMVDKVTTVRRSKLAARLGALDDASVLRLNRALVVSWASRAARQADSRPRNRHVPAYRGRGMTSWLVKPGRDRPVRVAEQSRRRGGCFGQAVR